MLTYIPLIFDVYQPIPRHLHWTMGRIVSFANRAGECWPSTRKLAEIIGLSKSTIARHLVQLVGFGAIKRRRQPNGCYAYTVAARFLPANRALPHGREKSAPPIRREEKPVKKMRFFERFEDSRTIEASSDSHDQWRQRVLSWQKRGFWLDAWGARPTEAGCIAPVALLAELLSPARPRCP